MMAFHNIPLSKNPSKKRKPIIGICIVIGVIPFPPVPRVKPFRYLPWQPLVKGDWAMMKKQLGWSKRWVGSFFYYSNIVHFRISERILRSWFPYAWVPYAGPSRYYSSP